MWDACDALLYTTQSNLNLPLPVDLLPPHPPLPVALLHPLLYFTLFYSSLLYSILLYSALLCSTLAYSTLLYSALLYSIYSALFYSTPLWDMFKFHVSDFYSDLWT